MIVDLKIRRDMCADVALLKAQTPSGFAEL